MIGDFPIQFSIYTNCLLHYVFLAWEACDVANIIIKVQNNRLFYHSVKIKRDRTVISTLLMMLGSISATPSCPLCVCLLSQTVAGNRVHNDVSNIKMLDNYSFIISQLEYELEISIAW